MESPDISWQLMTFKEKNFSYCSFRDFCPFPTNHLKMCQDNMAIYTFEGTYNITEFKKQL